MIQRLHDAVAEAAVGNRVLSVEIWGADKRLNTIDCRSVCSKAGDFTYMIH
jgi:hypothetical protein